MRAEVTLVVQVVKPLNVLIISGSALRAEVVVFVQPPSEPSYHRTIVVTTEYYIFGNVLANRGK